MRLMCKRDTPPPSPPPSPSIYIDQQKLVLHKIVINTYVAMHIGWFFPPYLTYNIDEKLICRQKNFLCKCLSHPPTPLNLSISLSTYLSPSLSFCLSLSLTHFLSPSFSPFSLSSLSLNIRFYIHPSPSLCLPSTLLALQVFGDASVAQSVLSNGANGGFLSINWGWGVGVILGVYFAAGVSGKVFLFSLLGEVNS